MGKPVIIEAGRSAIGKRNGAFADTHAVTLLGRIQAGVLQRAGVDPMSLGQVVYRGRWPPPPSTASAVPASKRTT